MANGFINIIHWQLLQVMNRLQEPLSRDMLTEEYLREVMSAHNEESDKKERQQSSLDLCKIGKR